MTQKRAIKRKRGELFYCEACRKVYEVWTKGKSKKSGKAVLRWAHYRDFPTYGLDRIKCPSCDNGQWKRWLNSREKTGKKA